MLNEKELAELGVLDWKSLAKDFGNSDLLLGNGFSLNISDRFAYKSLFKEFLKKCSRKDHHIFKSFETPNFEFILEKLLHAIFVNRIFGIDDARIEEMEEASQCLKDGLVETIQDIHPLAVSLFPGLFWHVEAFELGRSNQ